MNIILRKKYNYKNTVKNMTCVLNPNPESLNLKKINNST